MVIKIGVIFPGQGVQIVGRDQEISSTKTLFAKKYLDPDFLEVVKNGPSDLLAKTRYSQLAIFLISASLFDSLREKESFSIAATAGLSLGEYTALYASGAISFEEAFFLVRKRAAFMEQACLEKPGAMSAVLGMKAPLLEELISSYEDVWIANYNTPQQQVLSGSVVSLEKVKPLLLQHGAKVLPLKVEGAFHSPFMDSAKKLLAKSFSAVSLQEPKIPFFMNVTAEDTKSVAKIEKNLIEQVTSSVYWDKTILSLQEEIDLWIEIGSKTLLAMNRKMGVAPGFSIQKQTDIPLLQQYLKENACTKKHVT